MIASPLAPLLRAGALTFGLLLAAMAQAAAAPRSVDRAAQPVKAPAGVADLVWSTFLGGVSREDVYALAVDAVGTVYVGGETSSPNLATSGVLGQRLSGVQDGFVAKIAPAGDRLEFLTYLGGSDRDYVTDMVIDRDGSILVAGYTSSADFPVTGGVWDTSFGGAMDGFVARLDPTGARILAATFLGGRANDYAETVRLDDAGMVYASGETWSADLPTTVGAFDTTHAGASDMFVARLDADLRVANYVTFVGGQGDDCADCSMDVAGDGRATLVSKTNSRDMPVTAAAYDTSPNGSYDAFLGRLAPDGRALEFGTYLGGGGIECEEGCYVAVDADGSTVLAGNTMSPDFPTVPAAPGSAGFGRDGVLARLSPDGRQLVLSRRLAGNGSDVPRDLDIAADGKVLLLARTDSANFPVTPDGFDPGYNGNGDIAVLRLDGGSGALLYGSYLGGAGMDGGWRPRVVAGDLGRIYVAGTTTSPDFPTTAGAFQVRYNAAGDAFALVLAPGRPFVPTSTATPSPTEPATATRTPTPSPTATAPPTEPPPCVPLTQPADIVLVLDSSSSMDSFNKWPAAHAAILDFVAAAAAPPDQLALVTFAGTAGLSQPLTSDKDRLRRVLGQTRTNSGTRIDLALGVARAELAGPRHTPGRAGVILLLTDGVQNGAPKSTVLAEADAAKAAGALVYTIGLGADVDGALLAQVASGPEFHFLAPTAADLADIYRRISVAIPCSGLGGQVFVDRDEDGRYDPGVDAPLPDVDLRLAGPVARVVRSDSSGQGNFLFADIPAGAYAVTVDVASLPPGLGPTTPLDLPVVLGAQPRLDLAFGFRRLAATATPTKAGPTPATATPATAPATATPLPSVSPSATATPAKSWSVFLPWAAG